SIYTLSLHDALPIYQVKHRVRILDRFAFDRDQDIAGLQPCSFGGSTPQHALDQDPAGGAQAEGLAHFRSDLPRLDTDPAARDARSEEHTSELQSPCK